MTLNASVSEVVATGNGVATKFSFSPIVIPDSSSQIEVVLINNLLGTETPVFEGTGPSAWSHDILSFPGTGSITYPEDEVSPISINHQLVIRRKMVLEQQTDLENQGGYFPEVQELQYDRGIMIDQQQQDEIDRTIQLPSSSSVSGDLDLASEAAGRYLRINLAGTGVEWAEDTFTTAPVSIASPQDVSLTGPVVGTSVAYSREDHEHELPVVSVAKGGTGSTTAAAARTALDVYSTAQVYTKSEADALVDDLSGVTDAATARSNLGLVIGTDVQADLAVPSQAEAEAGTATTERVWTAQRVGQAIAALAASGPTVETPQATTSGSTKDFTGVPAGTSRISILFDAVSLSGTDDILVQIGDSGGFETSGYSSTSVVSIAGGANAGVTSTAGFIMRGSTGGNSFTGIMELRRLNSSGVTWISSHGGQVSPGTNSQNGGGGKSLTNELTQVRVTVTGTDTFDVGNVNVIYD